MSQINTWPGWECVRELGKGSFGRVYEIQRNVFGSIEKAAIKVISIPQDQSEIAELRADGYDQASIIKKYNHYLEDIVKEYSLMAKLKGNSYIVDCDDLQYTPHENEIGWDIVIKMELLTPLIDTLQNTISDEQVIHIGKDICNALIVCKKQNIIHRDIKPQNIFISPNGDYKLGDFGIAKVAESTTSGTKTGTYKYMAPEVYNNRPYGTSADLYSLGMVLYWLLNERRTPFLPLPPEVPTGFVEEAAKQRRFSGEPLPPPAHGSKKLQEIVLRACSFDPKERYSTPMQMRQELEWNQNLHNEGETLNRDTTIHDTDKTIHINNQENKEEKVYSTIDVLLKRGNIALEDHEWEKAVDFFEQVLNLNPECSSAYLGKWMAAEKQPNLHTLFDVLGNRYNSRETQTIEACPLETEHIKQMISWNRIPGYLDSLTIKKQYDFDRSCQVEAASRQAQKEKMTEMLSSEKLYTRALRYAQGWEKTMLEQAVSNLLSLMEKRISDAEKKDAQNIIQVKKAYQNHLKQADQKVVKLRYAAVKKREIAYRYAVSQMNAAKTISGYEKAKENLKLLNGYKNSDFLAEECQRRIDRIRR